MPVSGVEYKSFESVENSNINKIQKMNGATKRGTRIVKKGQGLDKNAFLKILMAELTNQNPFDVKDGTQYISQMAQFSAMEQMANLNSSVSASSAYALVGKTVAFNKFDMQGKQYGGQIDNIIKDGDNLLAEFTVKENGKFVKKQFDVKDIKEVINSPSEIFNLNNNMNFLLTSGFIGKTVEVLQKDGVYTGKVKAVYRDGMNINLNLDIDGKYIKQDMKLTKGYCKDNVSVIGAYRNEKDSTLDLKYNVEKNIYEYKCGDEEWKEYNQGKEVKGFKINLPKDNPDNNVNWHIDLTGVKKEERDVKSDDVILVKNS